MRCVTACLVAVLLVAGCSTVDEFAELLKRPDVDQASGSLTVMSADIRDRLGGDWRRENDGSVTPCGVEAVTRNLPWWTLPGGVSDEHWGRAEVVVGEIAAGHGFDPRPEVVVNNLEAHDVIYRRADGAAITFAGGRNTTLSVSTGCHLTPAAHRRGDR